MKYGTRTVYYAMAIPVLGWLYVAAGFVVPLEHWLLRAIWWFDIGASAGLHALQLFVAVPVARRKGVGTVTAVFKTMLLGATWWKPLRDGVIAG
jgi:olefin beta-lactone synthetase